MRAYIIRRLLIMIPTMWIVSLIVFLMMRFIPGDIVDLMIAHEMDYYGGADRADIEQRLRMDVPLLTQYGRWMEDLFLHGDLGNSLWSNRPVVGEILTRLPVTLELGLMALIVAQLIALPIGIYTALRQDTIGDYIGRSFAILAIAVPGFWLATLVIVLPSLWWGYMPPILLIPFLEDPIGNLEMFIIPAIVLGMLMSGITMRMTRTMMLEVLRQDYIRTAWAKGLRERVVVIRHALKNALIPVVTVVGMGVPVIIGGTVIIEKIFALPGMGRLLIAAVGERDYPIVSGILLVFAMVIMLTNLVVDLTYGFLDPRIRYR